MTYVLYKVGKADGSNESMTRVMSNDNVDALRAEANAFYAQPDNLVGRSNEQLIIPEGQLLSNTVTTLAGGQQYYRHIEIREIGKGKAQ